MGVELGSRVWVSVLVGFGVLALVTVDGFEGTTFSIGAGAQAARSRNNEIARIIGPMSGCFRIANIPEDIGENAEGLTIWVSPCYLGVAAARMDRTAWSKCGLTGKPLP